MFVKRFVTLIISLLLVSNTLVAANAEDYVCTNFKIRNGDNPVWSVSTAKNLQMVFTWTIEDSQRCVLNLDGFTNKDAYVNYSVPNQTFKTQWALNRDGDNAVITALFEVPTSWLLAQPNTKNLSSGLELYQTLQSIVIPIQSLSSRDKKYLGSIYGSISIATLWGIWFSKIQGADTSNCDFPTARISGYPDNPIKPILSLKVLEYGTKPKVSLEISDSKDCIFLIHTGPLLPVNGNPSQNEKFQAESPFWSATARDFFDTISSQPNKVIQVGVGEYTKQICAICSPYVTKTPRIIEHTDSVSYLSNGVKIESLLDIKDTINSLELITFYLGYYYWYSAGPSYNQAGWRVTWNSPTTFSLSYRNSSYTSSLRLMKFENLSVSVPLRDLLESPEQQAARIKIEQDSNAAVEKAAGAKKTTITCAKGKLTKKVTAVKPKCPSGYKVKK